MSQRGPCGPARSLCNGKHWWRLALQGQLISLAGALTGVCSQALANRGVDIPTTQSMLNYVLLCLFWIPLLQNTSSEGGCRATPSTALLHGSRNGEGEVPNASAASFWSRFAQFWSNRSLPWWGFLILALLDVEATFLVVGAYQYTSITSITLLDCFTIPSAMALSVLLLARRYHGLHMLSAFICMAGLVVLVYSDAFGGGGNTDGHDASSRIKGDLLVLAASVLYASSNVGEEFVVRHRQRLQQEQADDQGSAPQTGGAANWAEYLAILGLFGLVISAVQAAVVDGGKYASINWTWEVVAIMVVYGLCDFSFYALAASFLVVGDSALLNLGLLTSDIWAAVASVLVFQMGLGWEYFLSLAIIVVGLGLYYYAGEPGGSDDATAQDAHARRLSRREPSCDDRVAGAEEAAADGWAEGSLVVPASAAGDV